VRHTISGNCLCEAVKFELENDFQQFYQCHCKQCQQLTGTAFASNLFTAPDNIEWLQGEDKIRRYDHPTRTFSWSFCDHCGSTLPFVTKSGKALLVPAGCLNQAPNLQLQANIFVAETACWLEDGKSAKAFTGFPE